MPKFFRPERRGARRQAEIARWNRPLSKPRRRIRAWINMVLTDHGIFRLFYLNRHKVSEKFERAAQPAPHHIRKMAADGIRTIVNLRGGREFGSWPLERETAEECGIRLEEFTVRSRGAPDDEALRQLSPRYGHFRFSKTGILDRFFEFYRDQGEAAGLDFETWVRDVYDPEALERDFRPGFWSDVVVDKLLRRE